MSHQAFTMNLIHKQYIYMTTAFSGYWEKKRLACCKISPTTTLLTLLLLVSIEICTAFSSSFVDGTRGVGTAGVGADSFFARP